MYIQIQTECLMLSCYVIVFIVTNIPNKQTHSVGSTQYLPLLSLVAECS